MKHLLSTLLVICALGCNSASAAGNGEKHAVAVSYVIRSLGTDMGTVSAKTVGTASDNDFRADVTVSVRVLFFRFSLTSSETASIRGGKLVSYHKTIDSKGHCREITGERKGDVFTFVIRDGEKVKQRAFPVTDYVITNMEYPEVTLVPGEIRKMRVVDLENAEIVDREYRQLAEEQTEINGRVSPVMTTDFTDKNSTGRRWTSVISGLPIVMRQEGKEKTGLFNPSYSVRQTRIVVDP
ncbi:MAG: hypothetical protein HXX11_06440 [Desulfuromonadales bacterium]|nr:hypothetical protein [Desulfuromonadales bacterium]